MLSYLVFKVDEELSNFFRNVEHYRINHPTYIPLLDWLIFTIEMIVMVTLKKLQKWFLFFITFLYLLIKLDIKGLDTLFGMFKLIIVVFLLGSFILTPQLTLILLFVSNFLCFFFLFIYTLISKKPRTQLEFINHSYAYFSGLLIVTCDAYNVLHAHFSDIVHKDR